MELLAPAGSIAAFEAAAAKGANAIYVGAPGLNARSLSKDFTLPEIAAMIMHGHDQGVKVYVAMNSLLKEEDLLPAAKMLEVLAGVKADGLIIQDLGLYSLAHRYFPELRLHASTLMTAHNSLAVRQLADMGFRRVVLARELTLQEINQIRQKTSVELETFIHGALCFSYSGLCLFSSFLGGKSGLRGRCVQPCRRRYTWSGKTKGGGQSGYFFSMADLGGIELVHELSRVGVGSIKIEGRMRSAGYVGAVVEAYRIVLDAPEGDQKALEQARELLQASMGRTLSKGFFYSSQPEDLIAPQHSGNIGLFLGRIKTCGKGRIFFTANHPLKVGDRVRVHQEQSGERQAFTVKEMWLGQAEAPEVAKGEAVSLSAPAGAQPGDSVYKVDVQEQRLLESGPSAIQANRFVARVKELEKGPRQARIQKELGPMPVRSKKNRQEPVAWLRLGEPHLLQTVLTMQPQRLIITLSRETFPQIMRLRRHLAKTQVMIALPPIMLERDLAFYREAITTLSRARFQRWQIGHLSQLQFFKGQRLALVGDYTLNVLNSQSVKTLREFGLEQVQVFIETDRDNLAQICATVTGAGLGMTIYGRPPLFTARLQSKAFRYGQSFVSPKGETFDLEKVDGLTIALPHRPFSLLARMDDFAGLGLGYVVLDLSHMKPRKETLRSLVEHQTTGGKRKEAVHTFNYFGRLQ